jgi:hypothetical protein
VHGVVRVSSTPRLQNPTHRRPPHAQLAGDRTLAKTIREERVDLGRFASRCWWPAMRLPVLAGLCNACPHPFAKDLPLKLGDGVSTDQLHGFGRVIGSGAILVTSAEVWNTPYMHT